MTEVYNTYLHINETGVFYVGCGGPRRPLAIKGRRSLSWKQVASKGYSVLIAGEFENKPEAWNLEKELIAYFQPLCNKALGGPGSGGVSTTHAPKALLSMQKAKRGLNNPAAKLTNSQVLSIRNASGTLKEIANYYGISFSQVGHIKSKRRWSHI